MAMLDVRNLSVTYRTSKGGVCAVDDVSFALERGDTLGLVGESGSGKTTVGKAILRLLPHGSTGLQSRILFEGRDLLALAPKEIEAVRGRHIGLIPQSAMNALDPVMRVGDLIEETMRAHGFEGGKVAKKRIAELFATIGLDPAWQRYYPHMFSGGMRQRATIAMAFALEPSFIIADEPTTGLDVIVQSQVLQELSAIVASHGVTVILITHDIGVVSKACRRIAVMYAGRLVEMGPTLDVLRQPFHPYTMGLTNGMLRLHGERREIISIPGHPPTLSEPMRGCAFADRCPFAEEICRTGTPALDQTASGHAAACHFHERASDMRARAGNPRTWGVGP